MPPLTWAHRRSLATPHWLFTNQNFLATSFLPITQISPKKNRRQDSQRFRVLYLAGLSASWRFSLSTRRYGNDIPFDICHLDFDIIFMISHGRLD